MIGPEIIVNFRVILLHLMLRVESAVVEKLLVCGRNCSRHAVLWQIVVPNCGQ